VAGTCTSRWRCADDCLGGDPAALFSHLSDAMRTSRLTLAANLPPITRFPWLAAARELILARRAAAGFWVTPNWNLSALEALCLFLL